MLYKLRKERKDLSRDINDKVCKLLPGKEREWWAKFDDLAVNKDLYESLVSNIQSGGVNPQDLNNTISNKKALEELIVQQENELLYILNEPLDKSDIKNAEEKALELEGQGSVRIRPDTDPTDSISDRLYKKTRIKIK